MPTRDILLVGDVWACDLSPLELQNAETKRVASSAGSRRIEFTAEGQTLVGMRGGQYGPERLVKVQMYSTTMALSTMNNLLVTNALRRSDGPCQILYPESRRAERLFGEKGRTKSLSSQIKMEKIGVDYYPWEDACLKAFVRFMALAATAPPLLNAAPETDAQ